MKPNCGFAYALVLGCFSCGAQTNSDATGYVRFFLEPVRLRSEALPEINKTKGITSALPTRPLLANVASLETTLGDNAFHSRIVRENEFCLTQTTPRSDNAVARFIGGVFTPEVVQVGKVNVACPIVTVIKRRNPLCLLSGLSSLEAPTGEGQIVFRVLELTW